MRARAFTLRDGWPDKLKGMRSTEETMDAIDVIEVQSRAVKSQPSEQISFSNPLKTDEELAESFDALAHDLEGLDDWLSDIGKKQGMSLAQVKAEIVRGNDWDNCFANFQRFCDSKKPKNEPQTEKQPTDEPQAENAPQATTSNESDKTNTPAWSWLESPILERYSADKREILKQAAERKGLEVSGMKPGQVHKLLCQRAQGDFEDAKLVPTPPHGQAFSESDIDVVAELNELWVNGDPACKDYANDECNVLNQKEAMAKAAAWVRAYREFERNNQ